MKRCTFGLPLFLDAIFSVMQTANMSKVVPVAYAASGDLGDEKPSSFCRGNKLVGYSCHQCVSLPGLPLVNCWNWADASFVKLPASVKADEMPNRSLVLADPDTHNPEFKLIEILRQRQRMAAGAIIGIIATVLLIFYTKFLIYLSDQVAANLL